ncbi:MAG: right-handed parallel beta-helix repeat-containing protein [Uliginosibacterium sp.]|nr:right-handed parallel beta-helix repeat-containing protein [Uliginosibacterium sp.]
MHNSAARITLPDTVPNTALAISFDLRDTAYPGIPYESRPGVMGGIFPYEYRIKSFTLNGAPQSTAGVSLDFRRGTVRFTPAAEGSYVLTLEIKDSGSTQKTLQKSFTITSAASRFLFVATNGVDSAGRGTLAAPFRTLAYAVGQSAPNQVIVMRKGNYALGKSDLFDDRSKQIIAYPDEVVVADFAKSSSFWVKSGSSSAQIARFEGLDLANVAQHAISCDPCTAGVVIRNVRFVSGTETSGESDNPSFVYSMDYGLRHNKFLIQDNDMGGAYTMKYTANNYGGMVLFSAFDSVIENNQMPANQTGSIRKGFVDKAYSNNNTYRENYIEFLASQPEHDGFIMMAQDGSDRVQIHHNLLINAGITLGLQCGVSCHMIDHSVHHNTVVNGGVGISWGPLNPPSSGTRVSHNIIKSGSEAPYGEYCQTLPDATTLASKLSFGANLLETTNTLAMDDTGCGNDVPWAQWRSYGFDTTAAGSIVSATSALTGSGPLTGLPAGDARRGQRGHLNP